jgi:serine/threonine protein kinase/WD40 repeat protein
LLFVFFLSSLSQKKKKKKNEISTFPLLFSSLFPLQIYQKRNPDSSSGSPSLRPFERQLLDISDRLARSRKEGGGEGEADSLPSPSPSSTSSSYPHFLPVARALETPRAAYLLRPYAHTSLRARCGTRPFLSHAEKDWIAFQLLSAIAEARARGVLHGDLKAENVLLTSGGWLLLADFAPYKPGALPADNPADFTAFFDDASGSRRCCLAPERFVVGGESGGSGSGGGSTDDATAAAAAAAIAPFRSRHAPLALTEAMDVFSAGCVLAELYADGRALFDLSRLLAYRRQRRAAVASGGGGGAAEKGSSTSKSTTNNNNDDDSLLPSLSSVPAALRPLVRSMVSVDPKHRPTAAEALRRAEASGHFPLAFFKGAGSKSSSSSSSSAAPPPPPSSLHDLFREQHSLDADGRIAAILEAAPLFLEGRGGKEKKKKEKKTEAKPSSSAAASASAPAPASTSSPSIVRDVSSLLSATEGLLARLSTNDVVDEERIEEEGIEEEDLDDREPDVVVVERVDEVEFRASAPAISSSSSSFFSSSRWEPADPSAAGLTPLLDGVASGSRRTKEQVRLPAPLPSESTSASPSSSSWVWASEWALDTAAAPAADAQGWSYSGGSGGGEKPLDNNGLDEDDDDEAGVFAAAAASSAEWTADPSPDACWRRRQWVRVRRRVVGGVARATPAAAAAPAAVEAESESESESEEEEGGESKPSSPSPSSNPHHHSTVATVLTGLLASLLRGAPSPDARASGALCLARVAARADDAARLDRALPYLVALLTSDDAPRVRAAAVRALVVLLRAVSRLSGNGGGGSGSGGAPSSSHSHSHSPSSSAAAGWLSAFLWPSLGQAAASDGDEGVRVALAGALAPLACAAARLLRSEGGGSVGRGGGEEEVEGGGDKEGDDDDDNDDDVDDDSDDHEEETKPSSSDSEDSEDSKSESGSLVRFVERALHDLSVGASSSSATRLALLPGLGDLASLLGRAEANDLVLPAAITFLNDRDPAVRAAFFRHVKGLAAAAGPGGLEAFLLPCLEQALADESPAVAAAALSFLADACCEVEKEEEEGEGEELDSSSVAAASSPPPDSTTASLPGPALPLLRRRPMLAAARRVLPTALAPSSPAVVRAAGARFAAAAAKALSSPAEAFALISPLVREACERDPADLSDAASIAAVLLKRKKEEKEEEESANSNSLPPPLPPPLLELATSAPLQVLPASDSSSSNDPGASALDRALAAAGMTMEVEEGERESNSNNNNALFRRPATKELISRAARRVLPGGGGGTTSSSSSSRAAAVAASSTDLALLGAEADGEASFYGVPAAAVAAANAESAIAVAASSSLLPSNSSTSPRPPQPSTSFLVPSSGPAPCSLDRSPWRPRGSLVAHLAEHSRAVNAIAVPASGRFFATASSDGIARVWDAVGLERDASARSRAAYAGQAAAGAARLLCASSASASASSSSGASSADAVATGCSAGTVHVWRVGYAPAGGRAGAPERVAGIFVGSGSGGNGRSGSGSTSVRSGALSSISSAAAAASAAAATVASPGEGAVYSLLDWHPSSIAPSAGQGLLLYSTARGGVHGWDLRCRGNNGNGNGSASSGSGRSKNNNSSSSSQDAWVLSAPACEGSIRAIVADPLGSAWVLTGSSRGVLSLWDARLLIRVAAWKLAGAPSIDALTVAAAPWERLVGKSSSSGVDSGSGSASASLPQPPPPTGPLVWCAAGGEASLWEISRGAPRLVLRSAGSGSRGAAAAAAAASAATAAAVPLSPSTSSTSSSIASPPPLPTDLSSTSIASRSRGAVRSLLSTGAGPLITGGGDGVLRLWDCSRPDDSYVVAGFPPDDDEDDEISSPAPSNNANPLPPPPPPPQRLRPRNPRVFVRRVGEGGAVLVLEEAKAAAAIGPAKPTEGKNIDPFSAESTAARLAHRDSVTALASIVGQGGVRLLLSASRDGVVKAWR